jgi:hypothetical protein
MRGVVEKLHKKHPDSMTRQGVLLAEAFRRFMRKLRRL